MTASSQATAATRILGTAADGVLKDILSPAATRRYIKTQWPVIGGRHNPLMPFSGWGDPEIARHFVEGTRIGVGVLACQGLYDLARAIQIPIFKISTTADETIGFTERLRALAADCYGARYKLNDEWIEDSGFNRWELSSLPAIDGFDPDGPVRAMPRALSVVLPTGLSPRQFDENLNLALASVRLSGWVAGRDGQAHCDALNFTPDRFQRFTAYNLGGDEPRISKAHEIYIFKPRLQTTRLAAVIENILLGHIRRKARGRA